MTWPQYRRQQCVVFPGGAVVRLSPQQTEILSVLLMRYPGFTTYTEIIEALWPNPDFEPEYGEDVIRTTICYVRRRVGAELIINRRGFGYSVAPRAFRHRGLQHRFPSQKVAERLSF